MNIKTRSNHNIYDMLNMMVKSIRLKRIDIASYCAYELYNDKEQRGLMWDELIKLSDCNEIKEELIAIREADDFINKKSKDGERDPLFVAKAIVLLSISSDNDRNGECPELVNDNISIDKIKDKVIQNKDIPEWVFDCHTIKGKKLGKTDLDMTIAEENALSPKHNNFYDNCSWYYSYYDDYKNKRISDDEWNKFLKFAEGRPVK